MAKKTTQPREKNISIEKPETPDRAAMATNAEIPATTPNISKPLTAPLTQTRRSQPSENITGTKQVPNARVSKAQTKHVYQTVQAGIIGSLFKIVLLCLVIIALVLVIFIIVALG